MFFVQRNCQYCIENLPLYRDIANRSRRTPEALQVVVVGLDTIEQTQSFVQLGGLTVDHVLAVSPTQPRLVLVPTIAIVDRSGVIERIWVGQQPGARQNTILDWIQSQSTRVAN